MAATILEEADAILDRAVLSGDLAQVHRDLAALVRAARLETQALRALRRATQELCKLLEEERHGQTH